MRAGDISPLNSEKQAGQGELAAELSRAITKIGQEGQQCYVSKREGGAGAEGKREAVSYLGGSQQEGGEWFAGSW